MKVSILIPCFNEARTIVEVLERLRVLQMPLGAEKEIVVVDDGSTDGSPALLREYRQRTGAVLLHQSDVNLGKGAAVRYGIALATGDVLVIQDADLELSPEELPRLVEPILAGRAEVVFGSRFLAAHRRRPLAAYLANRFLTWLTCLLFRARLTDMETCYKAFRRSVVESICLRAVGFEIEPELTAKFLRLGYAIHELPISYRPRSGAQGKKIRARDGLKAIYYLFKYRFQPLAAIRVPPG